MITSKKRTNRFFDSHQKSMIFEERDKAIKQLKALKKLIKNSQLRLAAEFPEKWQILISTILSAQTKDETTIKYSEKLYKKYPLLKALSKAKLKDIKNIIKPINYHKTKARHIIETAKIILKKYKGRIPQIREELMELPGIGRKVANVYLVSAHNASCIGVDTHVAYLSQALGWTKNKHPHKIEKDLESLFPKSYWNSINWILVRFGRLYPGRKRQIEILKKNKIV